MNEFVSIDHNFEIKVKTGFDFDQSDPLHFQYLFKYTITIQNKSEVAAQLISRYWNIMDAKGEKKVVEGPGVIGKQPFFSPDMVFEYSSFCPLSTMKGEMWGHFNMINNYGQSFKIHTPHFYFEVPKEFIDNY